MHTANEQRARTGGGSSSLAALLVWLIVQVAALAITGFRLPTSARPSPNPEFSAAAVVLITQLGVGTVLFPWLFRELHGSLLVILSTFPMIALAAFLSATPFPRLVLPTLLTLGWLAALAILRSTMSSHQLQHFTVAIFVTLICIPLVLISFDPTSLFLWTPATSVLSTLHGHPFSIWSVAPSVSLLALAISFKVVGKPRQRSAGK